MDPLVRALLAGFLALAATGSAPAAEKVRVLTTVFPLKEFAAAVAGDRGEVELLLPPGAGPHTWQPRPGDIRKLAECDLLIYIGANLEPWLPGMIKALPGGGARTLEATAGLTLIEAPGEEVEEAAGHGHGAMDPHVWLDFGLDAEIVRKIADELSLLDPPGAAAFRENAQKLIARLEAIDAKYRSGLAGCRGRDIVLAGHGAFGYLARRYALTQTALYGLSPDAQPRPQDLMQAVDHCRERGIRAIFFENSVSPDLSKSLAREIGARILVLRSGHNLTRDEIRQGLGFFEIMEENLKNLVDGLGCG